MADSTHTRENRRAGSSSARPTPHQRQGGHEEGPLALHQASQSPRAASAETILALQRVVGNQAVQRMVAQADAPATVQRQPGPSSLTGARQIQRKLYSADEFEQLVAAPTITRKYAYRRAASSMKPIVDILESNDLTTGEKLPLLRAAIDQVQKNNKPKAKKYTFPLSRLLTKVEETEREELDARREIVEPDRAVEKYRGIMGASDELREHLETRQASRRLGGYDDLEGGDQDAISSIVGEYGVLQKMMRGIQDPSLKEMGRAENLVAAFSKMKPVGGTQERVADHFPNGKDDPSTLKVGKAYTDRGFFFVGDSPLVEGKYKMLVKFNHAYFVPAKVAKAIFNHEEPQYIMLPGSSFRYDGQEGEDSGRYVFTQVS